MGRVEEGRVEEVCSVEYIEVEDVVGSVGEVRRERWRRSSKGWKCVLAVYSGRISKCVCGWGSGCPMVKGIVAWRLGV